jgi:hypothetical protein
VIEVDVGEQDAVEVVEATPVGGEPGADPVETACRPGIDERDGAGGTALEEGGCDDPRAAVEVHVDCADHTTQAAVPARGGEALDAGLILRV